VVALAISAFALGLLAAINPVTRLVLDNELLADPGLRRYPPADIRDIRIGPDPQEDYAEPDLPVRLCQATVKPAGGRTIRLIVSIGDAARLRAWAERHRIPVRDADGYSTRGAQRHWT
jgi:hypothetical protein